MNKTLRVLHVEDQERDALLIARHLTNAGYQLKSERVDTAEAMRTALETEAWDIILCDYSMPHFDALRALGVRKELEVDTPLIIISGTIGEAVAVDSMLAGANDYLMKDNLNRLVPAIEREIHASENRREKKQADLERQQSDDRYRALFEYAPDGIIISSPEDYYLDANASMCQMLGYDHKDLIGMHARDIVVRAEAHELDSDFALVQSTPDYNREWHFKRKDGSVFTAEVIATIMPDGNLLAMIRDITDRKTAELQMELHSVLLDSIGQSVIVTDPTGNITYWNRFAEQMYGWPSSEVLGRNIVDVTPTSATLAQGIEILEALKRGESWSGEFIVQNRKGTSFPIFVTNTPLKNTEGKVESIIGISLDVTGRKRAEEALEESEERYRELVENALDIIYTHDLEGNYTSANRAAETVTGFSHAEIMAMNIGDTIPVGQLEKAKAMIAAKLAGEEKTAYELELIAKDGQGIQVEVNTRIIYENGIPVGVQGIARDVTQRKLANAEIQEKSALLEAQLNSSIDGILVVDENGKQILQNQQFVDLFKIPPQIAADPDDSKQVQLVTALMKDPDKFVDKVVYLYANPNEISRDEIELKDGTVLDRYSAPVLGKDNKNYGRIWTFRDITARKLAEALLSESQERLTLAAESVNLGIWDWDVVENKLVWDNRMYELYGIREGDCSGAYDAWQHGLHPDDREQGDANMQAALSGERQFNNDFRVVWPNGEIHNIEARALVERDDDGKALRMIGVNWDITERKIAEDALEAAEENYRSIFENAVEGIFQSTSEGRFLSANPAMARILGFDSPQELIALRNDIANQHYVDPESCIELDAILDAQGVVAAYECEVYRKDGTKIWTQENIRAIRNSQGELLHYEGSLEDITERKSLEDQFRQSQKMEAVGVMAGGIAHDFNNLLTAINGYSDLTLRKMRPEEPLRRNIEEVRKAGERAGELTSQLLAFSRKQVLRPVVYNLNPVVENIEKMLRRLIRENIELRTILDPNLGNIKADPGQIEQVIMNLTVNARDAISDGGTLTIETQNVYLDDEYISHKLTIEPGPFVRLTVTDTGHGMDASTQRQIFEPFFTTKEVGKGTGLGLSMVYGIVKQSGGDIMVYSEPGLGTTFKIFFPRVDEPAKAAKFVGSKEDDHSGTETILLVEDEEVVRKLVNAILTAVGYKVLEAENGEAALAICSTYPDKIDLLLTDIIMPKMSGFELNEQVLQSNPDIKVLFMSGYTNDTIANRGVSDDNVAFIEKPFTPDSLSQAVREVLAQ